MLLAIDQLTPFLSHCLVGHTIEYHHTLTSTMMRAWQLAADGRRSGTIVVAEEQSAGRGRQQRRWEAPSGTALLCSILLRAPLPVPLEQLPMGVGLAVLDTLEKFDAPLVGQVGLKWPNDVLLGRTPSTAGKVAGILIETAASSSTDRVAIVGIGINVNQTATDLPPGQPGAPWPTSLRLYLQGQTGQDQLFDRTRLLQQLCQAMGELLANPPTATVLWQRWREQLWTLHQPVVIREQPGSTPPLFAGQAVDVTSTGELVVVNAEGVRRTFAAGDVSLRRE